MAIEIKITAENALEAKTLVHDLAGVMGYLPAAEVPSRTEVSTVEEKPARTRNTRKTQEAATVDEPEKQDAATVEEPKQEPEKQPEVKQEPDVTPSISDEDLRAAANAKLSAGKRVGVKALVDEFKAGSVTGVPADQRADFLARLEAL